MELTTQERQWAALMHANQYLDTIEVARASTSGLEAVAREVEIDFTKEELTSTGKDDNLGITLDGGKGNRVAKLTNWSFTQLCRFALAPAGYLGTLPASVAVECLKIGMYHWFSDKQKKTLRALVHASDDAVVITWIGRPR